MIQLEPVISCIVEHFSNGDIDPAYCLLQRNYIHFRKAPKSALLILDTIARSRHSSSSTLKIRALLANILPDQISAESIFSESLAFGDYEVACQQLPQYRYGFSKYPYFIKLIGQNLLSLLFRDKISSQHLCVFLASLTMYGQETIQTRLLCTIANRLLSNRPTSYVSVFGRSLLERRILRRIDNLLCLLRIGDLRRAYSTSLFSYNSTQSFPRIYRQLFCDIHHQIPSYGKVFAIDVTHYKSKVMHTDVGTLAAKTSNCCESDEFLFLLSRMYLCSSASLVFVEVPKTASTFVLAAMSLANGDCPLKDPAHSYSKWLNTLRGSNRYLTRLSVIPLDIALQILSDERFKVFSFVRDPVSRFISSFYDKIILNSLESFWPWPQIFEWASLGKWRSAFVPMRHDVCAFAEGLFRMPDDCVEVHFRKQHLLIGVDLLRRINVFPLEDRASMSFFLSLLGQENSDVLASLGKNSPHSIPIDVSVRLRSDLEDGGIMPRLTEYYAQDLLLCHGNSS